MGPGGLAVTQQHIVGELSQLLGDLQPAPRELAAAIRVLRREVETSPLRGLPELTSEALILTDMVCWEALEHGERRAFEDCARTAGALRDFAESADLLR